MTSNSLLALLCLVFTATLSAQKPKDKSSFIWKVTSKGLQKPSYLFGTYHFLSNGYVDTMQAVKNAYAVSEVVAEELVIDSTIQATMMEASRLNGTTLQKELPETLYAAASKWFIEEVGFDFAQLNQLSPFAVMSFAKAVTQQKKISKQTG